MAALAAALAHPLAAIVFRAKWNGPLDGLDGLRWMAREAPGDREAVFWLRTHAVEGAVLAEATGNAYTDYGRIGAASGLPTVLGWENHEGLWRGGGSVAETSARKNDLKADLHLRGFRRGSSSSCTSTRCATSSSAPSRSATSARTRSRCARTSGAPSRAATPRSTRS